LRSASIIDVNSAKFIEKKTLEDTAFSINKEAAIEIAKQIRLRDIGGIIVIDFIDMSEDKNKKDICYRIYHYNSYLKYSFVFSNQIFCSCEFRRRTRARKEIY